MPPPRVPANSGAASRITHSEPSIPPCSAKLTATPSANARRLPEGDMEKRWVMDELARRRTRMYRRLDRREVTRSHIGAYRSRISRNPTIAAGRRIAKSLPTNRAHPTLNANGLQYQSHMAPFAPDRYAAARVNFPRVQNDKTRPGGTGAGRKRRLGRRYRRPGAISAGDRPRRGRGRAPALRPRPRGLRQSRRRSSGSRRPADGCHRPWRCRPRPWSR